MEVIRSDRVESPMEEGHGSKGVGGHQASPRRTVEEGAANEVVEEVQAAAQALLLLVWAPLDRAEAARVGRARVVLPVQGAARSLVAQVHSCIRGQTKSKPTTGKDARQG